MTNAPLDLLVLAKPPKPISEMTEAELHEFSDRLFDLVAARFGDTQSRSSES